MGAEKFSKWLRDQKPLMVTDTTLRDAHQSLMAARMRTFDMLEVADFISKKVSGLFSLEMWGGATYDTCMRFLRRVSLRKIAFFCVKKSLMYCFKCY